MDKDARVAELTALLAAAEAELARVRSKAIPAFEEVALPIEALSNIVYVTKHSAEYPQKVKEYMAMAEGYLSQIIAVTFRSLKQKSSDGSDGHGGR